MWHGQWAQCHMVFKSNMQGKGQWLGVSVQLGTLHTMGCFVCVHWHCRFHVDILFNCIIFLSHGYVVISFCGEFMNTWYFCLLQSSWRWWPQSNWRHQHLVKVDSFFILYISLFFVTCWAQCVQDVCMDWLIERAARVWLDTNCTHEPVQGPQARCCTVSKHIWCFCKLEIEKSDRFFLTAGIPFFSNLVR